MCVCIGENLNHQKSPFFQKKINLCCKLVANICTVIKLMTLSCKLFKCIKCIKKREKIRIYFFQYN